MFKVGDIIRLEGEFLDEKEGTLAYVYNSYNAADDEGEVSLITQNGVDLGEFTADEQRMFLKLKGHSNFIYKFTNAMKLGFDFEDGIFSKVFIPYVTKKKRTKKKK